MTTTLHLAALPHTRVSHDFLTCAYTMKTLKFCRMMEGGPRKIILYAAEGSDCRGAELVTVLSDTERLSMFGSDESNIMPVWPSDANWRLANVRTALAIQERYQPHDIVLLTGGYSQRLLAAGLPPDVLAVEPGAGYEGIFTNYVAFESYAWMHHVYGLRGIKDGRNYDAVIPNFFDPNDFPRPNDGSGDFLLFLGRVTPRKGVQEAIEVAKEVGMRLVVAGPSESVNGAVDEVDLSASHVEYIGPVGIEERANLLAEAHALIAPTRYLEPFGGVTVEAMMAGCPAITTDWGAFSENISPQYRFRTLAQGVQAVRNAGQCDRTKLQSETRRRFSLEAVAPLYQEWFDRLSQLWNAGWYSRGDTSLPTKEAA